MIALHRCDSPADIFRRSSVSYREVSTASAMCPFLRLEFPFLLAGSTLAHRASIDLQYFIDGGSISPIRASVNRLRTFLSKILRHQLT